MSNTVSLYADEMFRSWPERVHHPQLKNEFPGTDRHAGRLDIVSWYNTGYGPPRAANGAALGAVGTYAYMQTKMHGLRSERDKLRAERVVRDRDEMDQVSQLLQRGARATERAKKLVASKSRPNFETEEQQMRRTMPNLSPQKRIRPGAAGKDLGAAT